MVNIEKKRAAIEMLPPIVESPGPFIPPSKELQKQRADRGVERRAQVQTWQSRGSSPLRVKGE